MIAVNLNEQNAFSFEMQIEGSISTINSVNLIIETQQGFAIRIPAIHSNDIVEVKVPPLSKVIPAGEYPISLEVNIDGKLYVPLQESLKFETPVQIHAKVNNSIVETKNSVSVSKIKVDRQSVIEEDSAEPPVIETAPKTTTKPVEKIKRSFESFRRK